MLERVLRMATVPLCCLVLGAVAAAADGPRVQPGVYDPGATGTVSAEWASQQGLPDVGKSDHALILIKATATSTDAAAGAVIVGVEGQPAAGTYQFDIRADSYQGAGAPRFTLVTTDGNVHFIGGSIYGELVETKVHAGYTWYTLKFDTTNPWQAWPVVDSNATIAYLALIVDEDTRGSVAGAVILDNIGVNGAIVGKPGKSK